MDPAIPTDENLLHRIAQERSILLQFEKTFQEHERGRRATDLQAHRERLEATQRLIETARSRGVQFPSTSILSFSVGERVLDVDGHTYEVERVSVVAMLLTRQSGPPDRPITHLRVVSDEQVPGLKRLGGPA